MTQEELKRANVINEQIKTLERFLKHHCDYWGTFCISHTPKSKRVRRDRKMITLRTTYGASQDEISASMRLSNKIIAEIREEIRTLLDELERIN